MADNYVSIKIRANDDAKPDLTDLKAKLDELGKKVATARAEVDDKKADATLARLNARLSDLGRRVARPRIDVAGADRALADLLAVDVAMDRLKRKSKGSILSQFGGGFGSIIPGLPGGGGGGAATAGEGGATPLASILGSATAIGALAPAIGALLAELDGLMSGFAAAGAGAGAFALLAMPAVKSVTAEYQNLNAANQKYQQAVALEKMDPTKAHAAAVKAALDQVNLLGQAYGKLPGAEQGAIDGIYKLTRTFQSMSQAFMPEAFKVFAGALKLANELLPHITPFATTFADAFSGLLGKAGKFAGSKGFTDWLAQFQKLEGPSITAIGAGIGHLVTSFGKLLTIMSAKDVVNAINIAFSVLDGVLIGLAATIRFVMRVWDGFTQGFDQTRHAADVTAHGIAAAFDAVRHAAAEAFDAVRHAAAAAVDWIGAHWKALMLAMEGVFGYAVDVIATHWHTIMRWASVAFNSIRSVWNRVAGVLSGPVKIAAAVIAGDFRLIWGIATTAVRQVGRVWSAIESVLTSPVKSAYDLIMGWLTTIANFIDSLPGRLAHAVPGGGVVGNILHFAGLASGGIVGAASGGVHGGLRLVGEHGPELVRLPSGSNVYSNPDAGRMLGGGGGGTLRVQLEFAPGAEDVLIRGLRQYIRVKGGNVQTVLGQG